jgi:hypothetical protein
MLGDLCAALLGVPGDLFVVEAGSNTMRLRPNLPFITPPEEAVLNRICTCGTLYLHLDTFIGQHRHSQRGR